MAVSNPIIILSPDSNSSSGYSYDKDSMQHFKAVSGGAGVHTATLIIPSKSGPRKLNVKVTCTDGTYKSPDEKSRFNFPSVPSENKRVIAGFLAGLNKVSSATESTPQGSEFTGSWEVVQQPDKTATTAEMRTWMQAESHKSTPGDPRPGKNDAEPLAFEIVRYKRIEGKPESPDPSCNTPSDPSGSTESRPTNPQASEYKKLSQKELIDIYYHSIIVDRRLTRYSFDNFIQVLDQHPEWVQKLIDRTGCGEIMESVLAALDDNLPPEDRPLAEVSRPKVKSSAEMAAMVPAFGEDVQTQFNDVGDMAALEDYKRHINLRLETIFVIDLDDTLISRAVKEEYKKDTIIDLKNNGDIYEYVCNAKHPKRLIIEMKACGGKGGENGSRVILISNSSMESVEAKLEPFDLLQDFDAVYVKDKTDEQTLEGDKELKVMRYLQNEGFSPRQLVVIDDEFTHLDKFKTIATIMSIPNCVTIHPVVATPHILDLEAAAQSYERRGKSLPQLKEILFNEGFFDGRNHYQEKQAAYEAAVKAGER